MTLKTRIYIQDPTDVQVLFAEAQLRVARASEDGIDPATIEYDATYNRHGGTMCNFRDQGLPALLELHYGGEQPLRPEPVPSIDPELPAAPACYAEITLETGYAYSDRIVGGCEALHVSLVTGLGLWLLENGVRFQWHNEFTGEIHDGFNGLKDLVQENSETTPYFRNDFRLKLAAYSVGYHAKFGK